VSHAEQVVIVVGEERPAMSISFGNESGALLQLLVFFAEYDPEDPHDPTSTEFLFLHCLVEHDGQLARGLQLARRVGQADYDPDADEWFEPDDNQYRPEAAS
jgi:DNA-binding response OmpR family regulator